MLLYPKSVNKQEKLQFGKTYHIFNRAIGNDLLYENDRDYFYFLEKLKRFLLPWIDVLSYCLIPNHFHLLVTINGQKENSETSFDESNEDKEPRELMQQAFSNLFNSYSKSFNRSHNRKGRLFLYPFKRILVTNDEYLIHLVYYIHRNAVHHGLTDNYENWRYSSYNAFLSDKPTNISKDYVLSLFGSKKEFIEFHKMNLTKKGLKEFLIE